MKRKLLWLAFVFYCGLMLWLLLGQRIGTVRYENYWQELESQLNLIPFSTIRNFLRGVQVGALSLRLHAAVNLVGNVVMFVPLGVLPALLFPKLKRFWRALLVAFAAVLTVELVQLFTLLGTFDVDDVLLNLVGAAMGYAVTKILEN